jgi:hypothetical protein
MGMASIRFYKNKFRYPKYTETLTYYGESMDCTPVGINLRGGTIRVKGTFADFMSCNYMSLNVDGIGLWAWVDDVKFRTEDSFDVQYTVDAWRTYRGKISLGTQFIKRSPVTTKLKDNLLGSTQPYVDIDSVMVMQPWAASRIMVVQVRSMGGEVFSNTPVQPTPYQFYLTRFTVNRWQDNVALSNLISYISSSAETQNLVTMYSIPYMDIDGLPDGLLPIQTSAETITISGFKTITDTTAANTLLYLETPIPLPADVENITKVDHSIQVVIPEAGVITIPDEMLGQPSLVLRQDVDLFSGASNYMLKTGDGKYYSHSVRGSSISSIPIISDPLDTYLSQNQNALATSLIGDVASVLGGAAMMATPAGAALGGPMAALGGTMSMSAGLNGLMNTAANIGDAGNNYANPPAFLGQALAANFNQTFWVVTKRAKVTNEQKVHDNFGYPYNMVDTLSFPASGYIQTDACNVESTDGSVPRWALEEINTMFNNGVLVK